MRRFVHYILLLTALMATVGCKHDHLHYETERLALIHIEVDWSLTHLSPNGVSAYVFDSEGKRYSNVVLSSDPNNIYLKLPQGNYSVVFHNNSISELKGVELYSVDRFKEFSIHTTDANYKPLFEPFNQERFVNNPDDIASYTLRDLQISSDDVNYHYNKPDLADYSQEVSQTYTIQPEHIVHLSRIIAYVNGAEFLAPKRPTAVLHGMSGGYYFDAEATSNEDVMEQADVNIATSAKPQSFTKAYESMGLGELGNLDDLTDDELEELGMVYVDYNTFGMHTVEADNQKYMLHIRFYLYDGTYVEYKIDVTDLITTESTGTNNRHIIKLLLSALPDGGGEEGDGSWGPESDGDDTGDSGVFDPSIDEWVGAGVELPM